MPIYRHKPRTVEAFRFFYTPHAQLDWPNWFRDAFFQAASSNGSVFLHANGRFMLRESMNKYSEINDGDYILKDENHELLIVSHKIFEKDYEIVK